MAKLTILKFKQTHVAGGFYVEKFNCSITHTHKNDKDSKERTSTLGSTSLEFRSYKEPQVQTSESLQTKCKDLWGRLGTWIPQHNACLASTKPWV